MNRRKLGNKISSYLSLKWRESFSQENQDLNSVFLLKSWAQTTDTVVTLLQLNIQKPIEMYLPYFASAFLDGILVHTVLVKKLN